MLSGLFKKEKEQNQNYLAIVIAPDRVLATIWTFEEDRIKTLGFGHKNFKDEDVLIHQAAIAIDSAGEQAKVDITKTVYGLSEYYLEDGSLSRQSSKILKKLSSDLDLDPQAFVPLAASINHLLKVEESQTPHTVLMGIFENFCEVHLLESGKVSKTHVSKGPTNIEKLKNLANTLKEEGRTLPARIVVYGISESSQLAEKIANDPWEQLFMHEPKVDFLDDAELSRSIAYAQAADVLGYDPQIRKGPKEDGNINPSGLAAGNELPLQGEQEKEAAAQKEEETKSEDAAQEYKTNELGFVEGEDILLLENKLEAKEAEPTKAQISPKEEYAVNVEQAANIAPVSQQPTPQPKNKTPLLPSLHFPQLPNPLSLIKGPKSAQKFMIAAGILLFVALGGTFAFGQTMANATIQIKVNGKEFDKDFQISAKVGESYNKDDAQIGAALISAKTSASQKAVATGSKKIGQGAKGPITISNWTTAEKSFSPQTGIISKDGIKFSLDSDVTVASRSAGPGQANVNVTAVDLGTVGNLGAGNYFTFQEYDQLSYDATNPSAFSGGDERQATVVTKDDIDRLEKSVLDTATEKAKSDIQNQSGGQKIDSSQIEVKVLKRTQDKKADEEASLVNLDLEVEATAVVYLEDELKALLVDIYQSEAPQNLEILPENIKIEDLKITRNEENLEISGKLKASLVPKFNQEDLKNMIAGKSTKDTRAQIMSLGDIADVNVTFVPNIPIFSTIPRNKNKISFKVETN